MIELRKLSRVAVALGGFLIFVGTIMVTISALIFFGVLNAPVGSELEKISVWLLLIISFLNLISGILLVCKLR